MRFVTPRDTHSSSFVWLLIAIVAVVVALYVYVAFISPRPYFVAQLDFEHDQYYNAKNVVETGFPASVHHPGTPLYYLGALNLLAAGTEVESTQLMLDIGHVETVLITILGMVGFAYFALRDKPIWISGLALATVISWPTFFANLDYFSEIGFMAPLALLLGGYFWHQAVQRKSLTRKVLIVCGVGIGICVTLKLTSIPLGIAIILATFVHITSREYSSRFFDLKATRNAMYLGAKESSIAVVTAVATFIVLTLPVTQYLPSLAQDIWVLRNQGALGPQGSESFLESMAWVWKELPQVSLLFSAIVILFAIAIIPSVRRRLNPELPKVQSRKLPKVNDLTAITFLAVLGVAFIFALSNNVQPAFFGGQGFFSDFPRVDYGIGLRNVVPTNLFLTFAVLYFHRLIAANYLLTHARAIILLKTAAISGSVVIVTWASISHFGPRSEFIKLWSQNIAPAITHFEDVRRPGTRIALGLGYNGLNAGFHHYGNLAYGQQKYDNELARTFPLYTPLRLNRVPDLLNKTEPTELDISEVSTGEITTGDLGIKGRIKEARNWWENNLGLNPWEPSRTVEAERTTDLILYRQSTDPISIIAYPTSARIAKQIPQHEFKSLLCKEFGSSTFSTQIIEGREWEIFELTSVECVIP
jgi:hypothetical protein